VVLTGIENIDGELQLTQPSRVANFQDSCRHIHVADSTIMAACRRVDGRYEQTSIDIPGIENIDGHLEYMSR
jgi:hypothetical protein